MRIVRLAALAGITLVSDADAACRRLKDRSPSAWAESIVSQASVIMTAEVMQQQETRIPQGAALRPIKVYKGAAEPLYVMALPPSSGEIVTEAYAGFPIAKGERQFFVLFKGSRGWETSICVDLVVADSAVKAAVIRRASR